MKTKKTGLSWRARRAVVILIAAPGCAEQGSPEPHSAPDAIAAIERFSYTTPDGLEIAAMRAGEGRRVIFVHGTPGDKELWADYLLEPPFPGEYIAIDRPGFGASDPKGPVTDLEDQAAAILPLLEPDAEGRAPILVGHSLGGPIVAAAALAKPEGVGALALIAGSFDPDLEDVHPLQPIGESWPFRALLPRAIRNSNRELLALEPHLRRLAPRLETLTTPTVVLQGGRDSLVPASNVDFLKPRLTGTVDYLLKNDADHFVLWNDKPFMDDAIRRARALAQAAGR